MKLLKFFNVTLLIILASIVLAFLVFFFNLDPSGSGGTKADFINTWPYVELLSKHFYLFGKGYTDNTPLGYMFLSWIYLIFDSQYLVRIIYFIFSFFTIFLFYRALSEKFKEIKKEHLILVSSIIIILPAFLSGATWPNNSILANIFFLIFIIFYNRCSNQKKIKKFDSLVFFQILFLALTVYTRQYYAIFFFFLLYELYLRLNKSDFCLVLTLTFILSLPGFYIIFNDILVLKTVSSYKIYNTFLISPSIMFFYLFPIFFLSYIYKKENIISIIPKNNNNIILLLCLTFLVTLLAILFDYNLYIGGGFFFKLSQIIFKNNILGYLSSLLGLYSLSLLFQISIVNKVLIFLLIILFPSFYIFQKYFEPMFLIIIFLMLDLKKIMTFMKSFKLLIFLYLYYFFYFILAVLNDLLKITKSLIII